MIDLSGLSIWHGPDGWRFVLVDDDGSPILMSTKPYSHLSQVVDDLSWFGAITAIL
jgi:hypothetical protein